MPTYEYRCNDCHKEFSVLLTIAEYEKSPPPGCPHCNSTNVLRLFTSVIVQTSKKS
jgi:putative FmdB family regulatory protein